MTARAILWDLDGVIVYSMDYHYRAYSEVLSQRGVKLSREKYLKEMIGLRNYTILRRVLGDLPDDEIMRLAEQKEETFRRLVRGQVKPLPGAAELVRKARDDRDQAGDRLVDAVREHRADAPVARAVRLLRDDRRGRGRRRGASRTRRGFSWRHRGWACLRRNAW